MILIVHGYEGSGPGHWQHWLNDELRAMGVEVSFPALPDDMSPDRDVWVEALASIVRGSNSKVTLVSHSLGCWAVDHLVARHGAANLHAALLVAPPSPYSLFEPIQSFLPPPRDSRSWAPIRDRSLVLGSDDDDYASADEFEELGKQLEIACRILPGTGHLNAAAGYGPFPLVLEWLRSVGAIAH